MSILIIRFLKDHFDGHTPSDAGIDFVYTNTDGVDHIATLRVSCLADVGNNAAIVTSGSTSAVKVTV
jgi:hypothetical protein